MITKQDLEELTCANPECDHKYDDELILASQCHTGAPMRVAYDRLLGQIIVRCAICELEVIRIQL